MKTSTAILIVGGVGIAAYFLLRPKAVTRAAAPQRQSGQSTTQTVVNGLVSLGVSALGSVFNRNSNNAPQASSPDEQAVLDNYGALDDALSLNGIFGTN